MIMSSYLNGEWDKHLGRIVVMGNVWVRWSFSRPTYWFKFKEQEHKHKWILLQRFFKSTCFGTSWKRPDFLSKKYLLFFLLLLTLLLIFTTKEMSRCTLQNCERWTALGNVKMYLEPFFWNKCLLTGENPFNSHECALNTELELGGN